MRRRVVAGAAVRRAMHIRSGGRARIMDPLLASWLCNATSSSARRHDAASLSLSHTAEQHHAIASLFHM